MTHTNASNDVRPYPGLVVDVKIHDEHPDLQYKVKSICREIDGEYVHGHVKHLKKDGSTLDSRPFMMSMKSWLERMKPSSVPALPGAAAGDKQEEEN